MNRIEEQSCRRFLRRGGYNPYDTSQEWMWQDRINKALGQWKPYDRQPDVANKEVNRLPQLTLTPDGWRWK